MCLSGSLELLSSVSGRAEAESGFRMQRLRLNYPFLSDDPCSVVSLSAVMRFLTGVSSGFGGSQLPPRGLT